MKENMNFPNYATVTDEMIKMSPPATVSGLYLFGVPLPDLIQVGTAIYVVWILAEKGYALYQRIKQKRDASK